MGFPISEHFEPKKISYEFGIGIGIAKVIHNLKCFPFIRSFSTLNTMQTA